MWRGQCFDHWDVLIGCTLPWVCFCVCTVPLAQAQQEGVREAVSGLAFITLLSVFVICALIWTGKCRQLSNILADTVNLTGDLVMNFAAYHVICPQAECYNSVADVPGVTGDVSLLVFVYYLYWVTIGIEIACMALRLRGKSLLLGPVHIRDWFDLLQILMQLDILVQTQDMLAGVKTLHSAITSELGKATIDVMSGKKTWAQIYDDVDDTSDEEEAAAAGSNSE